MNKLLSKATDDDVALDDCLLPAEEGGSGAAAAAGDVDVLVEPRPEDVPQA